MANRRGPAAMIDDPPGSCRGQCSCLALCFGAKILLLPLARCVSHRGLQTLFVLVFSFDMSVTPHHVCSIRLSKFHECYPLFCSIGPPNIMEPLLKHTPRKREESPAAATDVRVSATTRATPGCCPQSPFPSNPISQMFISLPTMQRVPVGVAGGAPVARGAGGAVAGQFRLPRFAVTVQEREAVIHHLVHWTIYSQHELPL